MLRYLMHCSKHLMRCVYHHMHFPSIHPSAYNTKEPISFHRHMLETYLQRFLYLGSMSIPVKVFPLTEQMHQLVS